MRITIDIELTSDRIAAHLRDGTVLFDDVAQVGIRPTRDGSSEVIGMGRDSRSSEPSALVMPVVSRSNFDPGIAAAAARFIALKSWSDLRPSWTAILGIFDRIEVSIAIEGYERLTREDQRAFIRYLPYYRQITWWVGGEKVKF